MAESAPADTPTTEEKLMPCCIRTSSTPNVYSPFQPPPSRTRHPFVISSDALPEGIESICLYIFKLLLLTRPRS